MTKWISYLQLSHLYILYSSFSILDRSRDYENKLETIMEYIPRKTNHKHQNSIKVIHQGSYANFVPC